MTIPLLVVLFDVVAQEDSVRENNYTIKTFDPSTYRASVYNYEVKIAADGLIYFANENGLLEFDGGNWRLYTVDNFSSISSISIAEDGKVYTASSNDFGYFFKDEEGVMHYRSLKNTIPEDSSITQNFQIYTRGDDVFMRTREYILRWNQLESEISPIRGAWFADLGDEMVISKSNRGFGKLVGDSVIWLNEQLNFEDDAPFPFVKRPDGKFLAFTLKNGIYLLDEENNFSSSYFDSEASEFTKDVYLLDAISWQDSLVVIAFYDKGLIFINHEGEIVHRLDEQNELGTNYILGLAKDRFENLWVNTDKGIKYIKWKDFQRNDSIPDVYIHYIRRNDSLFKSNVTDEKLILSKSQNTIGFSFATNGYIKEDLEYQTLLKGFDKDWSVWGTETKRDFTNLSPGKYEFFVRVKNQFGVQAETGSFSFEISTPWYQTWWFYLLCLTLLIGLIVAFIHYRTLILKEQNKRLESIIQLRTKELLEQREALSRANDELKITNNELDNFVYRSSHDLVAPLKSLRGLVQISRNESDPANLEQYHILMDRSITKLEEFIKSIMDFSINSKRPIEYVPVTIDELIDNVIEDLTYYGNVDKVRFLRNYEKGFSVVSDPKRLKIIFSNLITNSVKYHDYRQDEQPYIKITAMDKGDRIEIEIADNGQGIDNQHQEKIFDMFYRATDIAQGSGLGLYIVKDTIEMLGGGISLRSASRVGSIFTINLPKTLQ